MSGAGWSRVTHPFATLLAPEGAFSFDLHVLGTPPAFILSQDQTLRSKGGPFSGPPDQTDSVPVWKCCLSIRTAASEMRRIKINVKDRNDGSLSSTPMCPSEQLVGISQSTVCSLCVDSIRFSRSPRARGPPPRPAGINSRSVRREEVYYALPLPLSTGFSRFFREPASGGPARALGAAGLRTLRLPRAQVKGDLGIFPQNQSRRLLRPPNAERPSSCERRGAQSDLIRGLEYPHAARQPS